MGRERQPLRKRNIFKFRASEHLKKPQRCRTCILDIVGHCPRHGTDISSLVVKGLCGTARCKHRHSAPGPKCSTAIHLHWGASAVRACRPVLPQLRRMQWSLRQGNVVESMMRTLPYFMRIGSILIIRWLKDYRHGPKASHAVFS